MLHVFKGPAMSTIPSRRRLAAPDGLWQKIREFLGMDSLGDWVFKHVSQSAALLVILLVVLILVLLTVEAWPAIERLGSSIITSTIWKPNPDNPDDPNDFGHLGGLTFIYGSVVTSALAMLIAVPLGVGTAAFLSEIATGWIKRAGSFLVELLAAIPSVVYGFWGINVLAPVVQRVFDALGGPNVGGKSIVAAGIILAVMIVPYIAAVAYDACQAVPRSQREGSFALGSTRWQTIWKVVLPYARPGIIGGCFLALGRAIGETMAVTMLIGNVTRIQPLPFGQGATIPSVVAQELPDPQTDMHRSALIELGLLLFAVTVFMNIIARMLIWRMGRERRGAGLWVRLFQRRPAVAERTEPYPEIPTPQDDRVANSPRESQQAPARRRLAQRIDKVMTGVLGLSLIVTCGPLFLILGYITFQGLGALDLDFFIKLPRPRPPVDVIDPEGLGGLANGLVGSLILVGLASLFALPLGLLAAIFLAEYRTSKVTSAVRFVGELLAGVPSIVIGTFVYALVRFFIDMDFLTPREQFSGWAGAFALGIMMMPIIMRASEEAIKMVPQSLRNASHALGAFHWQTVLRVCVPAALPAIITGAFLAIARIAGETAPLLLTIFGNDNMVLSPNETMGALPLYIYNYARTGYAPAEEKAWAAALVLLAFVIVLNVGVRIATGKRIVMASRAD
jgi:phosphate transport system permease protein